MTVASPRIRGLSVGTKCERSMTNGFYLFQDQQHWKGPMARIRGACWCERDSLEPICCAQSPQRCRT